MTINKDAICNLFLEHFTPIGMISVDDDGLVSVKGDCRLKNKSINKLPVKFKYVYGTFDCSKNDLTTLEGSPYYVKKSFDCSNNALNSLEGAPKIVDGGFICDNNHLTSLKWTPDNVGFLSCYHNNLTSLDGAPSYINGYFEFSENKLKSLDGISKVINGSVFMTLYPYTPLLKLLTVKNIKNFHFRERPVSSNQHRVKIISLETLFNKYYGTKNAELKVGLEMMKLGYGSNARL